MRKVLEAVSLSVLAVMVTTTCIALFGPQSLPRRFATHFDLAGHPDRWGSPATLLLLPGIVVVVYAVMTLTARFPAAFNYPVEVTAESRPRLQALALDLVSWMKMEFVCLFTWIQRASINSARSGYGGLSAAFAPIFLLVVFGTIAWFIVAMCRTARTGTPA